MFAKLIVGDSYSFSTTVADYPASAGWTLVHLLRPASGSADPITLTAAADGDDYLTTITPTASAAWEAGERKTLNAVTLSRGRLTSNRITILANPTEGEPIDDRSHARKALDAIEAVIEKRATMSQKSYSIRDRSCESLAPSELIAFRRYYAGLVANEEAAARRAAGLPDPRRRYVRFGRP